MTRYRHFTGLPLLPVGAPESGTPRNRHSGGFVVGRERIEHSIPKEHVYSVPEAPASSDPDGISTPRLLFGFRSYRLPALTRHWHSRFSGPLCSGTSGSISRGGQIRTVAERFWRPPDPSNAHPQGERDGRPGSAFRLKSWRSPSTGLLPRSRRGHAVLSLLSITQSLDHGVPPSSVAGYEGRSYGTCCRASTDLP